ncbi:MAG: DUF6430 domain-containing protein [Alphaproteobacteria bacterium]|nr:DUF6430 domain-containing protein [Alphaproteobacteria bacterium]
MWTKTKNHFLPVTRSIFTALGLIFLCFESYEVVSDANVKLPYTVFLAVSLGAGVLLYILDGYFLNGHLKRRVEITSHGLSTKIFVEFGDLFAQSGWKAVATNDFFDSIVDEDLVSSESLHGKTINRYWSANAQNWQDQVNASIADQPYKEAPRTKGNSKRYSVGTTASASVYDQRFLFVALGNTDVNTNVTTANAENLISAVRGMLTAARARCSNQPLAIPLMGSGLARVGIKTSVLVDLILTGVMEETKASKVTSEITIVLPTDKKTDINLQNYARNWN